MRPNNSHMLTDVVTVDNAARRTVIREFQTTVPETATSLTPIHHRSFSASTALLSLSPSHSVHLASPLFLCRRVYILVEHSQLLFFCSSVVREHIIVIVLPTYTGIGCLLSYHKELPMFVYVHRNILCERKFAGIFASCICA